MPLMWKKVLQAIQGENVAFAEREMIKGSGASDVASTPQGAIISLSTLANMLGLLLIRRKQSRKWKRWDL
jgi:hypothetical protein